MLKDSQQECTKMYLLLLLHPAWRTHRHRGNNWQFFLKTWTSKERSNHSILKEISPRYSLEGLMLKLKCQYFGHLMWRADSFEKTLMLGKIEGRRRRGQQRMRWLDGWTLGVVMDRETWHATVHGVTKSRTWLSNWTDWLSINVMWKN